MKYLHALVLAAAALLPGCGLFQSTPESIAMPNTADALTHWHISGKAGVRLRNEAHSAYVEWTQHERAFDVLLFGPLGQGKSRLRGDHQSVALETASGDVWKDQSPETLLDRLYGWQLPVSRAQYWVKGLVAPGHADEVKRNADGTLAHLKQDGWIIDYASYYPAQPAILPERLIMRYDDVRVTLVIKQWQALAKP